MLLLSLPILSTIPFLSMSAQQNETIEGRLNFNETFYNYIGEKDFNWVVQLNEDYYRRKYAPAFYYYAQDYYNSKIANDNYTHSYNNRTPNSYFVINRKEHLDGWFGANVSLRKVYENGIGAWYNTHTFDTGEFAKNIFDKVWKINNESDLDYWIDELDVKFTNSENWFVPGEVSVPYFPYDEPVNTFNNQYFVNTPSILKNIKADLRNKIKAQYNKIAKAIKEEQSIITKFNIENLKINVNFHMVNKQEHYFLSKIDKFKINISFDFKYEFKHISNAIENFHNKIKDKLNSEFIDLDSFKTIDIKNPFETDLFSSENLNNSNIKSLINTKNNIIINYLKNEYQKHELSKLINLNFKITENNKEKQYDIEYSYYYKNQTVPKILGSIKYQGDNTKYKNQLTTEAKKRLKFTSGVYIDKSDRNKYKIEEFETPEEKNNISYFNTFPIVEFVSSTTKNEVLFINDEPVPAFDNVFRLELKDNKIDKKNQSIWNKYLQAQENYLSNRNTNNKTAFENAKKNWDKLNTYKIEVKEFDSENKKFTTTYTKTIVINSQLDEFIEIKFYAWDPNKFPEQKEIINEYLKDSDDKFILNDNNEKIPNFKYNKFVNPKTGTNPEIIVLDYYNNVEKYGTITYFSNGFFNLKNPLNEKGEKLEKYKDGKLIVEAHVVYGGINLNLSENLDYLQVYKLEDYTYNFKSIDINFYKQKNNVFSEEGIFLFLTKTETGLSKFKIVWIKKNEGKINDFNDETFTSSINQTSSTPFWNHYWGKQLAIFLNTKYNISKKEAEKLSYEEILNYWKIYVTYAHREYKTVGVRPFIDEAKVQNLIQSTLFPTNEQETILLKEKLKNIVQMPYSDYIDTNITLENSKIIYKFKSKTNFIQIEKDSEEILVDFANNNLRTKIHYQTISDFFINNNYQINLFDYNNKNNYFFKNEIYENLEVINSQINYILNTDKDKKGYLTFRFKLKKNKNFNFVDEEFKVFFSDTEQERLARLRQKNEFDTLSEEEKRKRAELERQKQLLKDLENELKKKNLSLKEILDKHIEKLFGKNKKLSDKEKQKLLDELLEELRRKNIPLNESSLLDYLTNKDINKTNSEIIDLNSINFDLIALKNMFFINQVNLNKLKNLIIKNINDDLKKFKLNFENYFIFENEKDILKLLKPKFINVIELTIKPKNKNINKKLKVIVENNLIDIENIDDSLQNDSLLDGGLDSENENDKNNSKIAKFLSKKENLYWFIPLIVLSIIITFGLAYFIYIRMRKIK